MAVGADVAAPAERVYEVHADYRRWPNMFPTIRGVRLVHRDGDTVDLAVDHLEGPVPNRLVLDPPHRIVLSERKRTYDATFVHPMGVGTRFTVEGTINLRGVRRLLAPVVRPYARRLIARLQIAPVKAEAERTGSATPGSRPSAGRILSRQTDHE